MVKIQWRVSGDAALLSLSSFSYTHFISTKSGVGALFPLCNHVLVLGWISWSMVKARLDISWDYPGCCHSNLSAVEQQKHAILRSQEWTETISAISWYPLSLEISRYSWPRCVCVCVSTWLVDKYIFQNTVQMGWSSLGGQLYLQTWRVLKRTGKIWLKKHPSETSRWSLWKSCPGQNGPWRMERTRDESPRMNHLML